MELQQRTASAQLARNVSRILFSQNKFNTPAFTFSTSISYQRYNKQIVSNRFALHRTGHSAIFLRSFNVRVFCQNQLSPRHQ